MQAKEARDKCVRILLHVFPVMAQDLAQKLVFRMVDGLDDETVILREVKETTALAGRSKLRENISTGQ